MSATTEKAVEEVHKEATVVHLNRQCQHAVYVVSVSSQQTAQCQQPTICCMTVCLSVCEL